MVSPPLKPTRTMLPTDLAALASGPVRTITYEEWKRRREKRADPDYDEVAGEKWLILLPSKYNKHVRYAWRFDPCELGLAGARKPPPRRPMLEEAVTDDESE